tara:strand:+ start:201 stop:899 length:699 start_codon:yes stop_codon:yes gene_type:complete
MNKILISTATFNESKNIEIFLKKIISLKIKLDILVVDDNSPDGTSRKITKFKSKYKNIFLIKRSKKMGLDTAHKKIYQYALNKRYDFLITMDADLSHDPKIITKFLKYIKFYDFVTGSRYVKNGRNDLKGYRFFLSKYGNKFIRFMLGINLNEFTTSYRCYNLRKLKGFHLNRVKAKGYSFFMNTIYLLNKMGHSIKEIPIIFHQRTQGKSKIPKIEILRTLIYVLWIKIKP